MKGQGTLMLYKKVKYGDIRGKKKKRKHMLDGGMELC